MKPGPIDSDQINVKVWDVLIRGFHWLLVINIAVMLISAELENFDVHIMAGKVVVTLLAIRIVWGLIGSSNARFSALVYRPQAYIDYIRKLPERSAGHSVAHSPIGALAVIAILLVVAIQATSGLFAADVDGLIEGPFAYYITYELSRTASDIHLSNIDWLITIIVVHIAANLFYYFYKRDNLIKPMITGARSIPEAQQIDAPQLASYWKALWVTILVAALMIWLFVTYG